MNSEFNDHSSLISDYYPLGIITHAHHFLPDQGAEEMSNGKARRRRRKGKGGEGDGGTLRKRKLSEQQLNTLEKSFGSEHKLETERKEQLAAELGLDPRQVAVWFQNRRARWKTKKLEEEFSKLRSQHDSAVIDKCRLQTEIIQMKEQLKEAEKEIQRLCERGERFMSNSPSSSLSMDTNMEPQFGTTTQFQMTDNVFYEEPHTSYAHTFQWDVDDHLYYM